MKKLSLYHVLIISLTFLLILIFIVQQEGSFENRERSFITTCSNLFGKDICNILASNSLPLRRGEQMTDNVQRLFSRRKDLESISLVDGDTIQFIFSWSYFSPEKERVLIYQNNNQFNLTTVDLTNDYWISEENENAMVFTGGGINGTGYIKMERIIPCWFTIETYYPT